MRDPRLEELISAYLDGELSSDERLLVERELQQSSESRQLLEQLRLQRRMLQSLPRARLPKDLSTAVVRRIDEFQVSQPSNETRELRKSSVRRHGLNALLGLASVLAAGLLISMIVRDNQAEKNPLQPPRPDVVQNQDIAPELRLAAFEKQFPLLIVYDLAITPKGRQNKVLEQFMQAADIRVERSVPIEQRMEKGILESRFLAKDLVPLTSGGKKDVSAVDVEMLLIRANAGQIDQLGRQLMNLRSSAQDLVHLTMDMAMSKELSIFIHLNDCVDGGTVRQVSSETWTTPGAYSLKFRYAFNTKGRPQVRQTIGPADLEKMLSPNGPAGNSPLKKVVEVEQSPNSAEALQLQKTKDENEPSQLLIIVRHLNDNVEFPAVKGPTGN